jgi:hypothetical protein
MSFHRLTQTIIQINPELLELKKKFDQKMKLLVKLGLAVETESGVEIIEKQKKALTDEEVCRFEQHHSNFIELCAFRFQKDSSSFQQSLQINYDDRGQNPISKWFNIAGGNKYDNTFLFGKSIKNSEGVVGNFFIPWELKFISFTNPEQELKTHRSKKFKTEFEVIEINEEHDEIEAKDGGTFATYSVVRKNPKFISYLQIDVFFFYFCAIRWPDKKLFKSAVESNQYYHGTTERWW